MIYKDEEGRFIVILGEGTTQVVPADHKTESVSAILFLSLDEKGKTTNDLDEVVKEHAVRLEFSNIDSIDMLISQLEVCRGYLTKGE